MKKILFLTLICYIFSIGSKGQSLSAYKDGSKYGFKDKDGDMVIPAKYEETRPFVEYITAVKLNGKWGFIDKTDKEVIPFKYEDANAFSEGVAAVKLNGKWGYIDKADKEVIPLKYEDANTFYEDLAGVKLNGKWGYIDKTGTEVIPFKFGGIDHFHDGIARIKLDGKYGFVDKTGIEVIPLKFDMAGNFYESLAPVKLNGKCGFIDKTGVEVIPFKYDGADNFHEGLVAVKLNGKWGVIDKTNNVIIKIKYDEIGKFSENLAPVKIGNKWGAVDITGKEIIPIQYTFKEVEKNLKNKFHSCHFVDKKTKEKYDAVLAQIQQAEMKYKPETESTTKTVPEDTDEPKAYWFMQSKRVGYGSLAFGIKYSTHNIYGLKSIDGTVLIPASLDWHGEFNNCGLAPVSNGYINTKGEYIIPAGTRFYGFYSNCVAFVEKTQIKRWSIIDDTGKELLPLRYDNLIINAPYNNNALPTDSIDFIIAVKEGKQGAINGKGEEIIPAVYDEIKLNESWIIAKKDEKYGIFDIKGVSVYPFEYEDISFCGGGYDFFIGKKNEKYGIVNIKERKIHIPFNYAAIGRFDDMLGPFPVKMKSDGKWGYIDRNTKVVIPFQYNEAGGFSGYPRIAMVRNEYEYTIDERGKIAGLSKEEKDDINKYIKVEAQDIFFAKGDGLSFWDHVSSANKDLKNWNIFVVARVKNTGKLPKRIKAIPKLIITNKHTVSLLFISDTETDYNTYNAEWYMDIAPNETNVVIGYFKFQQQSFFHGGAVFGMGSNSYIDEKNAYRISFEYYDNEIPSSVTQQQSNLIETLRKNGNVAIKEGYASQYHEAKAREKQYESDKKIKTCLQCVVDDSKTEYFKQGQIVDKKGKIVMKNGDTYYYSWNKNHGYVVTGVNEWSWNDDIKSFEEMLKKLESECRKKYDCE